MARSGQLKGKVGDTELKGLLEQVRDDCALNKNLTVNVVCHRYLRSRSLKYLRPQYKPDRGREV